ncbi:MAG: hypothetical protein HZB33_05990 [Nitrospirae bacterium]|nr:hypothetical protein [Nitrospirota bacterium]
MASGQLGGPLYPTQDVQNKEKEQTFNLSFGQAIQEWNKHNYKGAVGLFKNHMDGHSDSPWISEAVLHMGCEANYNGRFSEAETHFNWIIQHNKDFPHEGARRLTGKAMLRLGVLKVAQNNPDAALDIFTELKEKSLDWRERTYASHWIQRISRDKTQGLARLRCGTEALAYLFEKEGRKVEAREIAQIIPETEKGHSISDIVRIAKDYGYELNGLKLSSSELKEVPLPAIIQIEGRYKGDKGHYWILEKIAGDHLYLYDPQSRQRFKQTVKEFSGEWNGKVLVSASKPDQETPGDELSSSLKKQSYGGCCGVPHPEENLGKPKKKEPGPCPEGAPVWSVNNINMNLYMSDIPLWYNPPIGPRVNIQLSYNAQSAIAYNEPFGNKWMFNYGSYPVVDTAENVTIFMPDGRRDTYFPDGRGGYTKPFEVFNTLTKIAENHYELKFPEGTVYVYDIPAGTSSQQPFLVEMRDAYGQKLTFGYNSDVKLTTITDALDRDTTLYYNADGLVDHVNDPFGRSASFEYDSNGNLTKITDMGGIWTSFSYDADIYLTGIENAKGAWGVYIEPSDEKDNGSIPYPVPGRRMWENYRITITNPVQGKEEFYYSGYYGKSWYVSPRDYIAYVDSGNNNTNATKTYYYLTHSYDKGKISRIEYPEGGYEEFVYDSLTGKPTSITDYHGLNANSVPITHTRNYSYNSNGLITSFTDAKSIPITYDYYPNNIDLWKVINGLGTVLYTYNGSTHDAETVTESLADKKRRECSSKLYLR